MKFDNLSSHFGDVNMHIGKKHIIGEIMVSSILVGNVDNVLFFVPRILQISNKL
jgi:hypothetical protein